jgi:hypothetical protein
VTTAGWKGLQATMQGDFGAEVRGTESEATSAVCVLLASSPPALGAGAIPIPTLRAVLVVLHVRRRRVHRC